MHMAWTTPALNDLEEIGDYIALESPLAAHRLVTDILARVEALLPINPRAGRRGRVPGTFELVIARTPYIVVYRITERVEVLAVVHGARQWPEEFR
jgi:toxin ParE1/3/4